jgi:hypothetical protein
MTIDVQGVVFIGLGVNMYLFATRRLFANPGDPRYEHFISRFAVPTKILSAITILLGVVCVLARL